MAATFVAAIFSRDATLRYLMTLIAASWFLTKFWRMGLPEFTFGYALIDGVLLAAFLHRFVTWRSAVALAEVAVQIAFLILHLAGSLFDFSDLTGGAMSDAYTETVARNVLFVISLLVVGAPALIRIALIHSPYTRRVTKKIIRKLYGLRQARAAALFRAPEYLSRALAFERDDWLTLHQEKQDWVMTKEKSGRWSEELHTIPFSQLLLSELLDGTTPEMEDAAAELLALDAMNIGIMSAEQRASNQRISPPWLAEVSRVVRARITEIAMVAEKRKKKRA